MKKILIASAFIIASMSSNAQFSSASITAAGLTCAMCTKAIYKALQKVPGVDKVNANIKTSSFDVAFKNGVAVDPDLLRAAVQGAGFSVSKFQLTGNFNHLNVSPDAHVSIDKRTFHFVNVKNGSLNGERTVTVVDKDFLSHNDFRKYASATTYACIQTGKAAACCEKFGMHVNERIYHVTL